MRGLGLLVAVAAIALLLGVLARGEELPPPPGWSSDDWAALPASKQRGVLQSSPSTTGVDFRAKLREIAMNPDPGPDPEAVRDALSDGPGGEYSIGIVNSAQSPLDRATYRISNSWGGFNAARTLRIIVYAGEKVGGDGLLVVEAFPLPASEEGDSSVTFTDYSYPHRPGPLTVTRGSSRRIDFTDGAGRDGSFDLALRRFA
jgi:hypothetical protein